MPCHRYFENCWRFSRVFFPPHLSGELNLSLSLFYRTLTSQPSASILLVYFFFFFFLVRNQVDKSLVKFKWDYHITLGSSCQQFIKLPSLDTLWNESVVISDLESSHFLSFLSFLNPLNSSCIIHVFLQPEPPSLKWSSENHSVVSISLWPHEL